MVWCQVTVYHETSYSVGTRSCFSKSKTANVDRSTPSNTYLVIYLFTYSRMYLLTPWSRVLLEKLTCSQLAKQFPAFYGTRNSSLLCLQESATCPWSKLDKSSPFLPSHFLKIHFDITLPSMPGSSKYSLSFMFPHLNSVCISPLPHTCYMSRPSCYSRFDHLNNNW